MPILETIPSYAAQFASHFIFPKALYSLAALAALILIYLLRPKPLRKTIPSLMFLLKEKGKMKKYSLFRFLIKDWLVIIQLLVLAAFAVAAAVPFILDEKDLYGEATVLVVDVSASSKVRIDGETRFESSVETAKSYVGDVTSVISAGSFAQLVVQDAGRADARKALSELHPTDMTTSLEDALDMAEDVLGTRAGRVVVFSDMQGVGEDFDITRRIIESKGSTVTIIDPETGKESGYQARGNIGIIDLQVDDDNTVVYTKNYDPVRHDITINFGQTAQTIEAMPGQIVPVSFKTPPGNAEITVSHGGGEFKDIFPADDTAYLSTPEKKDVRVLIITNRQESYIADALLSLPNVKVDYANPPIIPSLDYDVIILNQVRSEMIIPGTLRDIQEKVLAGATFIMVVQDDIFSVEYYGMNPVRFVARGNSTTVWTDETSALTKDIEIGYVAKHLVVQAEDGTAVVASTSDNVPIIAYKTYGEGISMYYGIYDDLSDFRLSPDYPLFWNQLITSFMRKEDLGSLNMRTGRILQFPDDVTVTTPRGQWKGKVLVLEDAGFYQFNDKTVAVNLLSEVESKVLAPPHVSQAGGVGQGDGMVLVQKGFLMEALAALVLLMLVEIFFIKFRGDV